MISVFPESSGDFHARISVRLSPVPGDEYIRLAPRPLIESDPPCPRSGFYEGRFNTHLPNEFMNSTGEARSYLFPENLFQFLQQIGGNKQQVGGGLL
jgi:hypothetical protein